MDNTSQEKSKIEERIEQVKSAPKEPESGKDIGKKAASVIRTVELEGLEVMEGTEAAEEGRVSEVSAEDKTYVPGGGARRSYSADEIEAIRAKLLAALPPQDVMIKQIRKKLVKEEKILTKRMKKFKRRAHKQAFQLTIVVMQLRKLREYFHSLAHATYEMIKHLWLKIVHGV